ncbi:13193_t:CDS:1 [Ambispora leptoticha]|uniref:13193_t:CDS:1 n=1 Tax=Ambispora leptoticha TaxID=144679 RepID=A0A9N9G5U3_9GLOM|nr:13193_t:CDS:1 [Ambispora leptoticha]
MPREDWLLWQFADSALPTGGFVASSGLESAAQTGYVHDVASLSLFVSSSITNYAYSALPFMNDAWKVSSANIIGEGTHEEERLLREIMKVDDLYDACTSNTVAKRASKAQGVAMLTLFGKSFANEDSKGGKVLDKIVEKFKFEIRRGIACGHLPVCFGMVASCLGISLGNLTSKIRFDFFHLIILKLIKDVFAITERAQHLFLFLFARAILSAAVRLNIIGPYYSQRMLTESQAYVEEALTKTKDHKSEKAVQTSPLLDIFQARHDKLYSRLFNS